MKATELYDLAVASAKANLTETNPIKLTAASVAAAESGNVDAKDFNIFTQYLGQARAQLQKLATTTLPSEVVLKPAAPAPTPAVVKSPVIQP